MALSRMQREHARLWTRPVRPVRPVVTCTLEQFEERPCAIGCAKCANATARIEAAADATAMLKAQGLWAQRDLRAGASVPASLWRAFEAQDFKTDARIDSKTAPRKVK